ncbi:MAG: hypothetical protein HY402_06095 [Elusimicrobia bacterium]|nr:hypothetical protein [Elusimicrobiota bacterium]
MWKSFFAVLVALMLGQSARAQGMAQDLGLGVVLGSPFGASAKYWLNTHTAVDAALGAVGDNFDLHADVLGHLFHLLPQPQRGTLPLFVGMGGRLLFKDDAEFGLRFVGGVAYFFDKAPLELYAEIAPILRLTPSVGANVDGGIGLRYYFNLSKKPRYPSEKKSAQ